MPHFISNRYVGRLRKASEVTDLTSIATDRTSTTHQDLTEFKCEATMMQAIHEELHDASSRPSLTTTTLFSVEPADVKRGNTGAECAMSSAEDDNTVSRRHRGKTLRRTSSCPSYRQDSPYSEPDRRSHHMYDYIDKYGMRRPSSVGRINNRESSCYAEINENPEAQLAAYVKILKGDTTTQHLALPEGYPQGRS